MSDFERLDSAHSESPGLWCTCPPQPSSWRNQTHRLILLVHSLRTKNPEAEVLLFPFLCFLPSILFVPDLNRGLQRRAISLVQEINTKRIRPPSSLLTLSLKAIISLVLSSFLNDTSKQKPIFARVAVVGAGNSRGTLAALW